MKFIIHECSTSVAFYHCFTGFPDPFVKVSVDGTGQVYTTEPSKATLYPKWNTHYDLFLGRGDGITISVWNHRKIHKKQGGGFLGCVRISAATIQRLKDTGCMIFDLNLKLNLNEKTKNKN